MEHAAHDRTTKRFLQIFGRVIIGILVMGALALLSFVAMYGQHGYVANKRSIEEKQRLIVSVKAAQLRNQALEKENSLLRDDPKIIEKIAREELLMTGPHERIIRFIKPNSPGSAIQGTIRPR
ncbi:MAG: septum formation initiator family protein [Acidobacteria bacterium]|nr:septum formation initiator family protein [Acidobacteriota bacterium]MBI3657739.1 septum formation initiator family protein [Acidobacteriota bacterium]